jgi:A/G-specific adenine glycosylase
MTEIQSLIITWYQENKRDLPWRRTKNPYFIWLSEVILQQTRVIQGMSYYEKFVEKYPKIEYLASANEQEVLSTWQGLGYYSRARNLHTTAKLITNEFKGVFPSSYEQILKLKGVGEYTAAAIASFAYDKPYAVVDGNVFRLLSRIFNIETPIDSTEGKKQFTYLANELMDKNQPALFNQAIMEFGALQCVPGTPNCEICPLLMFCEANKNKNVSSLPIKNGKTKVRNRYFLYFVKVDAQTETLLLRQKTETDIWQNMYEFPKIEFESLENMNEFCLINRGAIKMTSSLQKHVLSHQHLHAQFVHCSNSEIFNDNDTVEIPISELGSYPLPRLIDRFLEQNQLIFPDKP